MYPWPWVSQAHHCLSHTNQLAAVSTAQQKEELLQSKKGSRGSATLPKPLPAKGYRFKSQTLY